MNQLFESLDRRSTHAELRPAQAEVLSAISKQKDQHDLVLKLSTGAGKSLIGLTYLYYFGISENNPVVYLCPTRQLIGQVVAEARNLHIPTEVYAAGDRYPSTDGLRGKAIIICTYDKLFNAKSTFNRSDVLLRPSAIVLDDVHAGIDEIRDAMTVLITNEELRRSLVELFAAPCRQYHPTKWREIESQQTGALFEVPYWLYRPLQERLVEIIEPHTEDAPLVFVWRTVRDILKWCRVVFSSDSVEIVPEVLPVQSVEAFTACPHRLFMSGTLSEDAVLVRELGCEISSGSEIISSERDRGMGERMIVAPSLISPDFDRIWTMKLCAELAKRHNVIALVPSEARARDWEPHGAVVVLGDDVEEALTRLHDETAGPHFYVFSQRYDGVDLPDDACRVLVMDGIPFGSGGVDRIDSENMRRSGGIRNRIVSRIEQGMGRAVRSHVDYAVVLLAGAELSHFVAKADVQQAMGRYTVAQLNLAFDLVEIVKDQHGESLSIAVRNMIEQCLSRSPDWKRFYGDRMATHVTEHAQISSNSILVLATAEREAFSIAKSNRPLDAAKLIRETLNRHDNVDMRTKGIYLQRIAAYTYEADPDTAFTIQRSAYEANDTCFCPPVTARRVRQPVDSTVQRQIANHLSSFARPSGVISQIQELKALLNYSLPHNKVEAALKELAVLLGAEGQRPDQEHHVGPDVLWMWADLALIIEAKNEKTSPLSKADAGQMLESIQWYEQTYAQHQAYVPIIATDVVERHRDALYPKDTRLLPQRKLAELIQSLESFYSNLVSATLLAGDESAIRGFQNANNLLPEQFVPKFTLPLN